MKKLLNMAIVFLFVLSISMTASATLLFEDNFNSNIAGLNSTPTGWTVTDGTVDIIGVGTQWNYFPAYGLYIDLDGSTSNAGILSIGQTFNFLANTQYFLSFDLAGSQRPEYGPSDSVSIDVIIGNANYILLATTGFNHFTVPFASSTPFSGTISFSNAGGDNVGALLDNVRLESVPEPATLLLLGAGLIGLAGFGRRKLN